MNTQTHTKGLTINVANGFALKSELFYILLLALTWSKDIIGEIFILFLKFTTQSANASITIYFLFLIICIIGSFNILKKYICFRDVLLYLVLVAVYVISGLQHPSNQPFLFDRNNIISILLINMPMIFIGITLERNHINHLFRISVLSLYVFFFFYFVFNFLRIDYSNVDRMDFSYYLLIHVSIVGIYLVGRFTYFRLITFGLGFFMILALGTRGPLLIEVLFIGFLCIYKIFLGKKRLVFLILVVLLFVSLYFCFNSLFNYLFEYLRTAGFNTRIFDMFNSGSFFESSGREFIADYFLKRIEVNPYGYGLGYDHMTRYAYAHNIIIELMIAFGRIKGIFLFSMIAILCLLAVLLETSEKKRSVIIAMIIGPGFVKLFLSSSFLLEPFFFMLLGISISSIRTRRIINLHENSSGTKRKKKYNIWDN